MNNPVAKRDQIGRFALDPKAPADVHLTTPATYRSSDEVDGFSFPARAARVDALTAFNDEDRTYTIGGDLNIRTLSLRPDWVDTALPVLAQLHRAGFVGDADAYSCDGSYYGERTDQWILRLNTPSGTILDAEVDDRGARTRVNLSCAVGHTVGVESAGPHIPVAQDDLVAAIRKTLGLHAIEKGWESIAKSNSSTPFNVGPASVLEVPGGAHALSLHPRVRPDRTFLVVFDADGDFESIVECEQYNDPDAVAALAQTYTPAPGATTAAMATLGRRIGLGRSAAVVDQVHQMFEYAMSPAVSKDLQWLDANIAQVAGSAGA